MQKLLASLLLCSSFLILVGLATENLFFTVPLLNNLVMDEYNTSIANIVAIIIASCNIVCSYFNNIIKNPIIAVPFGFINAGVAFLGVKVLYAFAKCDDSLHQIGFIFAWRINLSNGQRLMICRNYLKENAPLHLNNFSIKTLDALLEKKTDYIEKDELLLLLIDWIEKEDKKQFTIFYYVKETFSTFYQFFSEHQYLTLVISLGLIFLLGRYIIGINQLTEKVQKHDNVNHSIIDYMNKTQAKQEDFIQNYNEINGELVKLAIQSKALIDQQEFMKVTTTKAFQIIFMMLFPEASAVKILNSEFNLELITKNMLFVVPNLLNNFQQIAAQVTELTKISVLTQAQLKSLQEVVVSLYKKNNDSSDLD